MLTKVSIVKAVVFPVFMYGYESWTIKKANHWRGDALNYGAEEDLRVTSKEIKYINSKVNQRWIFIGRTDAEAPLFRLPIQRANSFEKTLMLGKIEGKRRRGWQSMRLGTITDSMENSSSKLQETVKDREAWHATQFIELQRVRHCLGTEQQHHCVCCLSFLKLVRYWQIFPLKCQIENVLGSGGYTTLAAT